MTLNIKTWLKKYTKSRETHRIREVEELFYISEEMGKIYIMCAGYAIKEMEPFASTNDVINALNEIRKCAVSFYLRQK